MIPRGKLAACEVVQVCLLNDLFPKENPHAFLFAVAVSPSFLGNLMGRIEDSNMRSMLADIRDDFAECDAEMAHLNRLQQVFGNLKNKNDFRKNLQALEELYQLRKRSRVINHYSKEITDLISQLKKRG